MTRKKARMMAKSMKKESKKKVLKNLVKLYLEMMKVFYNLNLIKKKRPINTQAKPNKSKRLIKQTIRKTIRQTKRKTNLRRKTNNPMFPQNRTISRTTNQSKTTTPMASSHPIKLPFTNTQKLN